LGQLAEERMFRFPTAVAAAAILFGTATGISGCGPQTSVTQKYTPTAPVSRLIVAEPVGSVSVSSGSGSKVSVTTTITYRGSRPSITHKISGRTLALGHSACSNCDVAFTVTVPRAASVAIHLSTGSVTVARLAGDVSVADGTGSVRMAGLTGHVSAWDDTGSIGGTGLSAMRASFHDGTGDIHVAFTAAPRKLSAVTRTGSVSVRLPSGTAYQVHAGSRVGSVRVSVPHSPTAPHVIIATTSTGRVSVS
jgi:hypothetical protein